MPLRPREEIEALDGGGWFLHWLVSLLQGITDTHFIGGLVCHKAGQDNVENLAPTGIRFPDRLSCSESLYCLRYHCPPYYYYYYYYYISAGN
jgi:hypothetical protein